jgi:DNA-binding MarR family transcriptional regulator
MRLKLVPAVHRATHRVGLYLADLCQQGLSQGEAHILAQLIAASPQTIAQLHKGLAHKRSTLTSILDRLVQRGLITREVSADDRRTFLVRPTPAGRKVALRVHRHLSDLERAVCGRVTSKEVDAFLKVLSAVEELSRQSTRRAKKPG